MLLIDDILLRSLGITLKPFDIIWLIELMRDYALKEKYNIKKIDEQIKENRLFLEIGEITEEDYNQRHEVLLAQRETASEIMNNLSKDMKIHEI